MPRGGRREGAGRPVGTGKFGEPTAPIRVPLSFLNKALTCIHNQFFRLPFYQCQVAAGIPSEADSKVEKKTDLNDLLIKKPKETFLVKVTGFSMIKAGIQNGDILVVDSSIEPANDKIAIASINGELTVKRLLLKGKKTSLIAENDSFDPIEISEAMDFKILGIVTYVIHDLQKGL